MHESSKAFGVFNDNTDVRTVAAIMVASDTYDVSVLKLRFDSCYFVFRYHVDGHSGQSRFMLSHT